jgi:hypothetical protein
LAGWGWSPVPWTCRARALLLNHTPSPSFMVANPFTIGLQSPFLISFADHFS